MNKSNNININCSLKGINNKNKGKEKKKKTIDDGDDETARRQITTTTTTTTTKTSKAFYSKHFTRIRFGTIGAYTVLLHNIKNRLYGNSF